MDEKDIIKLIPKRPKGILRLVFSRFFIVLILLSVQLFLLALFFENLMDYVPYFTVFQIIFEVGMIIYLFNCAMDNSAKLTWLIMITIFPVLGTFLLWFSKIDAGHAMIRIRFEYLMGETHGKLKQDEEIISRPELISSGTDDLCRYLNINGCYPIYGNTSTRYFSCGEQKYAALLKELKRAEKFIFMEYFIIDEGEMWGTILGILKKKAEQGIEVRVMYDGMCEMSSLSYDYSKRMRNLGIKCKAFSPIRPLISTYYNYRDHRKILVIDGHVAFTGGINLADEYVNKKERFGHWKDAAVMLRGDAVSSFTLMFLQMWNISETEPQWDEWLYPEHEDIPDAKGYVMPYGDCPLNGEKVGENVYIDILYRAKSYVHIMTPYLILDGELENALEFAAKRGVDVKIILPGIPDKKAAYALAKTHYRSLIRAGVEIYEYTPGFVHSKVFVSDDTKAVVGSINLDYRSLYHHFECAAYMYDTECIPSIEEDFCETLKKCRKADENSIKNEKLFYKVAGGILKPFSPLM
ncbi:MAG: cardiolipin synthase [Ruminococcus sp.]|nr:cardiolipin synthase [Ruminococcus sp.]